jgi:hypothetical protein
VPSTSKTRALSAMKLCSACSLAVSAAKVVPVSRTSACSAPRRSLSTSTTLWPLSMKTGRLPRESLRSWERPMVACAEVSCQDWNVSRVCGSKMRSSSSNSTVGATCVLASRPSSG